MMIGRPRAKLGFGLAMAMPGLAASPVLGDTAHAERVGEHLSQLEVHAQSAFRLYDLEVDPQSLTLGQLAAIEHILASEDSESEKRGRIEAVANQ